MTDTTKTRGRPPATDSDLTRLASAVGGQAKLAEMVGVSRSTIKRWVSGSSAPARAERVLLSTIAAAHGLPAPFPT